MKSFHSNSSLAETAEDYLGMPERFYRLKQIDNSRRKVVIHDIDSKFIWVQLEEDAVSVIDFMAMIQQPEHIRGLSPMRSEEVTSQKIFLGT